MVSVLDRGPPPPLGTPCSRAGGLAPFGLGGAYILVVPWHLRPALILLLRPLSPLLLSSFIPPRHSHCFSSWPIGLLCPARGGLSPLPALCLLWLAILVCAACFGTHLPFFCAHSPVWVPARALFALYHLASWSSMAFAVIASPGRLSTCLFHSPPGPTHVFNALQAALWCRSDRFQSVASSCSRPRLFLRLLGCWRAVSSRRRF